MNTQKKYKRISKDIRKLRTSIREKYEKLSIEFRDVVLKIDTLLGQLEEIGVQQEKEDLEKELNNQLYSKYGLECPVNEEAKNDN